MCQNVLFVLITDFHVNMYPGRWRLIEQWRLPYK